MTNKQKIEQLEAILDSGALSGSVDGQSVSFRTSAELRSRIRELREADADTKGKRPRFLRANMGGV